MRHVLLPLFAAALLAACTTSEVGKLTSAKEDFNKATQRVVNYELLPRCSDTVLTGCGDQKVVNLLVEDVNGCNTIINSSGDSKAVRSCTTALENDLATNHVN